MTILQQFLRRLPPLLSVSLAALLYCSSAMAAGYLAAEPMAGKKIRIDGVLNEWPNGFDRLKTKTGSNSGNSAIVGYDKKYLYLAAEIKDSHIVRTKYGGKTEDHLTLDIYFPSEKGKGQSHRIDFYPGVPGKMAALVKVDGKAVSSAKAIEAPTSTGFTLEARLPWVALSASRAMKVGMRGKLTYRDASSKGRIKSISTAGSGRGKSMTPLTTASETGLAQALLQPKRLGYVPAREVFGDITGKGGSEKVALYGHFLTITGPGYKDGHRFYYNELDVVKSSQVTRLELLDFNGDGKKEIIIQKQLGPKEKYREVIQVLQITKDGSPLSVFMHEVSLVTRDGRIENKIRIKGTGKRARIMISQGKAEGFDPESFREPTIGGGIHSALLPWQSVKSREFGWKGRGLARMGEESWTPKVAKHAAAPSRSIRANAPPAPRPPNSDEMLDRVYGLYKQNRGIRRGKKPSFDFVTDVVEDEQMERVIVHDRDLLVFGKGFKKGLSYTYLTIGVTDAKDILSVTSRDLVGDGKAEILVHAIVRTQASESLGGEVVSRQALFVYKVMGEQLGRIFAAETARSLKGKRVMSALAFLPSSNGTEIELRPLRALGWTQKNYPFPEDQHPAGGMEPLLLPWGTVGPRRYAFNGSSYAQK